jgi:hypothetical protein
MNYFILPASQFLWLGIPLQAKFRLNGFAEILKTIMFLKIGAHTSQVLGGGGFFCATTFFFWNINNIFLFYCSFPLWPTILRSYYEAGLP